jgi:hypothetical protein
VENVAELLQQPNFSSRLSLASTNSWLGRECPYRWLHFAKYNHCGNTRVGTFNGDGDGDGNRL